MMAKDKTDENAEANPNNETETTTTSKKKLVLMIAVPIVLVSVIAIPAYLFLGGSESTNQPEEVAQSTQTPTIKKPLYYPLAEDIVVNIAGDDGSNHIMRIAVTIMTRDQAFFDAIKDNEPVIRNDLLALFGDQNFDKLKKHEAKQQLRVDAKTAVEKALSSSGASNNLEAVLFTNFVME